MPLHKAKSYVCHSLVRFPPYLSLVKGGTPRCPSIRPSHTCVISWYDSRPTWALLRGGVKIPLHKAKSYVCHSLVRFPPYLSLVKGGTSRYPSIRPSHTCVISWYDSRPTWALLRGGVKIPLHKAKSYVCHFLVRFPPYLSLVKGGRQDTPP